MDSSADQPEQGASAAQPSSQEAPKTDPSSAQADSERPLATTSQHQSPTGNSRVLLLTKVGLGCFAIGAITSAALALGPQLFTGRGEGAAGTTIMTAFGAIAQNLPWLQGESGLIANQVAGFGVIAQNVSTQGLGAFPGEVSASYLCVAPPELTSRKVAAGDEAIAPGIMNPAFGNLISAVDPSFIEQFRAAPWPEIHDAARQARVPVLMYHDILEEKEVFFDVTVEEFAGHLERIEEEGLTPISFDQLYDHLRLGSPLPPKPVLLTFDDGYEGHYTHVYPLLQEYQYPAVFSIFTGKLDGDIVGRSTVTWEQ
ncbi:MAG: polysaccharide deacetylase family protein, partial [Cyanobacteria bacterium P01_D01_bin.71]